MRVPGWVGWGLRLVWQIRPNLFTCALFWATSFWWAFTRPSFHSDVSDWFGNAGIAANALVTLANGGFMPVVGAKGRFSLWVVSDRHHRLLWLADRYKVGPFVFSVGDFLIFAGLAIGFAFYR